MATPPRQFVSGSHYHVYNRGNHKQSIFYDTSDYHYFLDKLLLNCLEFKIEILAYCLMKNHYHLLLKQTTDNTISKAIWNTTVSYVKRFNKKYSTAGRLFQERFRAILIDNEAYLLHVSRYIHLNPTEFTDYQTYPWSSYRSYLGQFNPYCNPEPILKYFKPHASPYHQFVQEGLTTPGVATLVTPGVGELA